MTETGTSEKGTCWLIWDGDCGFCRRSMEWVAARDRTGMFHIVPYQEAPSPPMTETLRGRAKQAVQVITPNGTVLAAGRAAAYILEQLGKKRTARLMMWGPFRPLTEWGYRRVANNRDFFSKFMFRKSCAVE